MRFMKISFAIFLVVLISSCSNNKQRTGKSNMALADQNPESIVRKYIKALSDGDVSVIKKLSTDDVTNFYDDSILQRIKLYQMQRLPAHNDTAVVWASVFFHEGGKKYNLLFNLVRQGKLWKIVKVEKSLDCVPKVKFIKDNSLINRKIIRILKKHYKWVENYSQFLDTSFNALVKVLAKQVFVIDGRTRAMVFVGIKDPGGMGYMGYTDAALLEKHGNHWREIYYYGAADSSLSGDPDSIKGFGIFGQNNVYGVMEKYFCHGTVSYEDVIVGNNADSLVELAEIVAYYSNLDFLPSKSEAFEYAAEYSFIRSCKPYYDLRVRVIDKLHNKLLSTKTYEFQKLFYGYILLPGK